MVKVFIHTQEKENDYRYITSSYHNIIIQNLFKNFGGENCSSGLWKIGQFNLNLLISKLKELNIEILFDDNIGLSEINQQIMENYSDQNQSIQSINNDQNLSIINSLQYLQDNNLYKIKLPVNKYMFACFYKLRKKQILKDEWVLTEDQFREFQKVCFEKNFIMKKCE